MSGNGFHRIQPEEIAQKIKAIRNDANIELIERYPGLFEVLWFIQAMSLKPRGLRGFAEQIVSRFPEKVGTKTLRKCRNQPKLTEIQANEVYLELPCGFKSCMDEYHGWNMALLDSIWEEERRDYIDGEVYQQNYPPAPEVLTATIFAKMFDCAPREIETLLIALCKAPDSTVNFESAFFEGLWDSILITIREHGALVEKKIAQTIVTRTVFKELEFALRKKRMIQIEGLPRIGKTKSISTWCEIHLGRARLVTVPCSNTDSDFYKAIADAIGMQWEPGIDASTLKERIEFVLSETGLMLVFDEAHFLIPQRYSETTPPMRLNWVRGQITDRGIPIALVTTPQAFSNAYTKFKRKTNYRFDQWLGRVLRVELPPTLSSKELVAVGSVHFPNLNTDLLELIAAKAMQSEGYVKAVEDISLRASFVAECAGRIEISEEDVQEAIAYVLPDRARGSILQDESRPLASTLQTRVPRRVKAKPVRVEDAAHPEDVQFSRESHCDAIPRSEMVETLV